MPKLIEFVVNGKDKELVIATNGTLHPAFDPSLLVNDKITVRISNYPAALEKGKATMDLLRNAGVQVRLFNFAGGSGDWSYLGGIDMQREDDDSIVAERFNRCSFNKCLTLDNGKLAYCSRAVIAERVQGFTSQAADYVKVDSASDFNSRLNAYINDKHFMTACRYCYGTHGAIRIEPAVQM